MLDFRRRPVVFSIISMKPLSPIGLPVLSYFRKALIVSVSMAFSEMISSITQIIMVAPELTKDKI